MNPFLKTSKKNKKHQQCRRCGGFDCFTTSHKPDPIENTQYVCQKCGYQGVPDTIKASANPFLKESGVSVADDSASNKPSPENDPTAKPKKGRSTPFQKINPKYYRFKDPTEEVRVAKKIITSSIIKIPGSFSKEQYEQQTGNRLEQNVNGLWVIPKEVSENASLAETNPDGTVYVNENKELFIEKADTIEEDKKEAFQMGLKMNNPKVTKELHNIIASKQPFLGGKGMNPFVKIARKINPFTQKDATLSKEMPIENKKSSFANPFVKEAREFKLTKDQEEENKTGSPNKGVSPISPAYDYEDAIKNNKDVWQTFDWHSTFSPIDRLEARHSPDPREFIPGYKEWHDREVDKYYDGWVDDHIENSGGSVVGSNTEKTMNLNEGERNHPPTFPDQAPYEKLLESRHSQEYEEVVASKQNPFVKKAQWGNPYKETPDLSPSDIMRKILEARANKNEFVKMQLIHNLVKYFRGDKTKTEQCVIDFWDNNSAEAKSEIQNAINGGFINVEDLKVSEEGHVEEDPTKYTKITANNKTFFAKTENLKALQAFAPHLKDEDFDTIVSKIANKNIEKEAVYTALIQYFKGAEKISEKGSKNPFINVLDKIKPSEDIEITEKKEKTKGTEYGHDCSSSCNCKKKILKQATNRFWFLSAPTKTIKVKK